MACTKCCNQSNLCGFGVGLDAPSNTTAVGVLLTNNGSISGTAALFSVNFQSYDTNGSLITWAQVLFEQGNFYLVVSDSVHNNSMTQITGISYSSSNCYFLGLQISGGQVIGSVTDSTGTSKSTSTAITATSISWGFVMTEDNTNTYVFFEPTWSWVSVSGCGVSATFWAHGFVYKGQGSCSSFSTKEDFNSGAAEITLGPNAVNSPSCGTQLW